MRGNVMDMAVGIIIGAAFGKIVGSLVDDIPGCRLSAAHSPCGLLEPVYLAEWK